jgi:hypothetical protein
VSHPQDGFVGFISSTQAFDTTAANGISSGQHDFFAVFVHEVTEVMGRQLPHGETMGGQANSYGQWILRFSAPGARDSTALTPAYIFTGRTAIPSLGLQPLVRRDSGDWRKRRARRVFSPSARAAS